MKRIIHLFALLTIFISSAYGQITLTIENVNTATGNNIPIALNATNFNDVGAVSIKINYDATVLEFVQLQNSQIPSPIVTAINGVLTIGWFDASATNPLNLGNAKLADLVFNYFGGNSDLTFQAPPVTEISNSQTQPIALTLNNGSISGGTPSGLTAPTLESPANGTTNQSLTPSFNWSDVATAISYDVQIATDISFANLVVDQQGLNSSEYNVPGATLSNSTTYYWRARANNSQTSSPWSSIFSFVTLSVGAGDVSVIINTITVPPGTEIAVPLTVTNFNSIGSVSLRINFDNTKLSYKSLVNKTDKSFSANAVGSVLNIFWFDNTGGASPLNVGDGPLFDLVFDYIDDDLPLIFDLGASQVTNTNNEVIPTTFVNGSVIEGEPLPDVPVLSSPADDATDVSFTPTLDWNTAANANSYNLQLATDAGFTSVLIDETGLTNTSYTIADGVLSQNTEYFWHVSSTGNSGNSAFSETWSFTTLLPPLPAPDLNTPEDNSTDVSLTPVLDWTNVNEATTYRVQISILPDFSDLNLDRENLTNSDVAVTGSILQEGTIYYWRANASDALRTSDWSAVFSFTTLVTTLDTPVLQSPADGSADFDPNSVNLDWTDVTDATSYDIQVADNSNFSGADEFNSASSDFTLDMTTLDYESQYFWRVKAKNATKESIFTSAWNFTTMLAPLEAPGLIAPADGATSVSVTLTLDWSNVANATGYGLQIATDDAFNNKAIDASNLEESSYSIPDGILSGETMYYWRVNATDGNRTSDWSEVRSFTTEVVISVDVFASGVPDDFALLQNYPNPFNPSTKIRFALPEASEVRIAVVDLLGREVATLYDGQRSAGFFETNWNASSVSSGTYIYRIDAKSIETGKEFSQMKKMLFVK